MRTYPPKFCVQCGTQIPHTTCARKYCSEECRVAYRRTVPLDARATHCKHGHKYTPENTYLDPRGEQMCKTCMRESQRRTLAKVDRDALNARRRELYREKKLSSR